MDDKLRSEVMADIESMLDSNWPTKRAIGDRYREVMTAYSHLETENMRMRGMLETFVFAVENDLSDTDIEFAVLSHAKAFLEENDERTEG